MILDCQNISKAFGTNVILDNVSFHLEDKEKMAIVGINGAGKTTLLKIIMNEDCEYTGEIKIGQSVNIGYIPQEINFEDDNQTILNFFEQFDNRNETEIRTSLAKYMFRGNDVFNKVSSLSGGEKVRLILAKLLKQNINFLILDEPTNHIDIETRELLEEAIKEYSGTVLFVSHDRYFINKLSTRVLSIGMNGAESFEGGYDDYAVKFAEQSAEKPKATKTMGKGGEDYKRRKERESELRRTITAIKKCEERINELDGLIAKTNEEMSTPEAAADYARVMELTETLGKLNDEQTELMMQWEELENRKAQLEEEE